MVRCGLVPAALLLLLVPLILTQHVPLVPVHIVVENVVENAAPLNYRVHMVSGGTLQGALKRLMDSNPDFKFTVSEDPDFGPFLQSVNGLAGSEDESTYWELLFQTPDGEVTRKDVGIGCYGPREHETVILRFTKY